MTLKWLLIFGALLVLPFSVKADCAWVGGGTCSGIATCAKASQESFCDNASNKNKKGEITNPECCCCQEEVGCCLYYNKIAKINQAGDYDRARCYGFVYFADIKNFDTNAEAVTNQKTGEGECQIISDSTTSCCECTTMFESNFVTTYHSVATENGCLALCSAGNSVFFKDKTLNASGDGCENKILDEEILPTNSWQNALPTVSGDTNSGKFYKILDNPLGTTEIPIVVGRVVTALINIIGAVALLVMVYGGWIWLTAMGDKNKITQGIRLIIWSAIGLIIIFLGYVIVKFVFDVIGAKMPIL
ncbi:hypothetical protein COT94_03800 [Candidatus Falkowbacteria bacterium CG10_big_fil_rev_8_21_14_0_10_37_14]|uniref:Uncharacterized protein n=1 Tax=Candidatus Falkowbacteria bacterium CG10_big_fil_rev_8_21_14_0_10_37_14 TaxID=1974561 RepID=A0A2M6WSA2_9BACT|nr:hypothetical protein [Candidatus Falkowbacteria bacterium]PIT95687.1 MAG: hypothetical protein COT94_03800 [Candidatus Falkowbacteria bacterium CG10_big_fil_rev_8_21_14_0_10_37_14]